MFWHYGNEVGFDVCLWRRVDCYHCNDNPSIIDIAYIRWTSRICYTKGCVINFAEVKIAPAQHVRNSLKWQYRIVEAIIRPLSTGPNCAKGLRLYLGANNTWFPSPQTELYERIITTDIADIKIRLWEHNSLIRWLKTDSLSRICIIYLHSHLASVKIGIVCCNF